MRSVTIVPAFMNPIGTYFRLLEETRLRLIQYCYTSFYSRLGKFLRNLFPMNTCGKSVPVSMSVKLAVK